jgi:hypothetical protein
MFFLQVVLVLLLVCTPIQLSFPLARASVVRTEKGCEKIKIGASRSASRQR